MRLIAILLTFVMSVGLYSQEQKQETPTGIFQMLAKPDSLTGATVNVVQDSRIETSLADRKATHTTSKGAGPGFRIQVFSSNVQRTAKSEAFSVEKEIRTAFPETGVYVSYISPFWKVRVGDFKTAEEAKAFRDELISTFPNLRNAIYTVKDKINY